MTKLYPILSFICILSSFPIQNAFANSPSQVEKNGSVDSGIHSAPIIIPASKLKNAAGSPIGSYRLFRTDAQGVPHPIPFQIDEVNSYGDYVLNKASSIGLFDNQDELSFMGEDVGQGVAPKWPKASTPDRSFEIKLQLTSRHNPVGPQWGAVFLAIFKKNPPALSQKSYVTLDIKKHQVLTARYRYKLNSANYMVTSGIDILHPKPGGRFEFKPLVEKSEFNLMADMKYFLTLSIDQDDIESQLEDYKSGPIRSIIRVSFHYQVLKMNFELGMYTEVSFFSNAVILPAVFQNPLDGPDSLNTGSGFHYGFAFTENPAHYQVKTNLAAYSKPEEKTSAYIWPKPSAGPTPHSQWVQAMAKDHLIYLAVDQSRELVQAKNRFFLYKEDLAGNSIKRTGSMLGDSPLNIAMAFDLTKFRQGVHTVRFRLFLENSGHPNYLQSFQNLDDWHVTLSPLKGALKK